jgi:hypothetical protein
MYQKSKPKIKSFAAPPNWCWPICKKAFHDACVEGCAITKDCSQFEPNEVFELIDLPSFPLKEWQHEMTSKERQAAAGVYIAKIVDCLQGRQPDVWNHRTRPYTNRPRNSRISEAIQEQSIQPGAKEPDSSHQDREEREDQAFGPSQVVGEESPPGK